MWKFLHYDYPDYLHIPPVQPITVNPDSHDSMSAEIHQGAGVSAPTQKKRLIVCCDGTWMNSDKGYEKGKPQNPSNVTRLARSFKRGCDDGSVQVINYQSGVGTGGSDAVSGGAFGSGIAEVGTYSRQAGLSSR